MTRRFPIFRLLGAVLLLAACGDDPSSPTKNAPGPGASSEPEEAVRTTLPPFVLSEPAPFYRLDLARDENGSLSLASAERVELEQLPLPALSAEYLVVAYAGDVVVSAVPLVFPDTVVSMGRDADSGAPVHGTTILTESVTSVFIEADASLDRIAVTTPSGDEPLEIAADDLPAEPSERKRAARATPSSLGTSRQPITTEQLAFRYAHIRFLTAGDDALLPTKLLDGSSIVATTDAMNDVLADGLAKLAPAMLSSVQTIAVVRWPAGSPQVSGILGMALGSQLVLNADLMADPEMVLTIVHEVAHNFTFLSEAAATNATSDLAAWSEAARNAAASLVRRYRLVRGIAKTWEDLHATGVEAGLAVAYAPGNAWMSLSTSAARAGGFASPYGSTSPWEDLAEYAGSVQAPSTATPGICPVFAGGGTLAPKLAIPYAKLTLLLGVGAITESSFSGCVQGTVLGHQPGIDFPGAISFKSQLQAGYLNEKKSFGILGAGPNSYQILVEVELDSPGGSPLGLHRLSYIGLSNVSSSLSGAYLSNDDPFLARASEQGLVLVTEATAERSTGAIFGLVFQNAVGINTDFLPYGSFRIP
jgi:hypothetical protein